MIAPIVGDLIKAGFDLEVKNDGSENPAQVELYVVWSEVNGPASFQA